MTEHHRHYFNLRPDLEIRLTLPEDLTQTEAQRLAEFILTLPFEVGPRVPYELVFFGSCGTGHVPPYAKDHPTIGSARKEAQRVYPNVINAAAHTPLIYGPGLPNDGILAITYPTSALSED